MKIPNEKSLIKGWPFSATVNFFKLFFANVIAAMITECQIEFGDICNILLPLV